MLDVVIIGAGPAGLALARQLGRREIRCVVLEKYRLGETWHRQPPELKLLSPWWTNLLDWQELLRHNPLSRVAAADYLSHLQRFAVRHRLQVMENSEVVSVSHSDGVWQAVCADGQTWQTRHLVCSSGYFNNPSPPRGEWTSDCSVPAVHAAGISDFDQLLRRISKRTPPRLVVVGRRVTAGQVITQLATRGCEVWLACHAPPAFRRSGFWARLREEAYFVYEAIKIQLTPDDRRESFPEMDGGEPKRLIKEGQVRLMPAIQRISQNQVFFADGSEHHADCVIFATGYAPSLGYLEPVLQSPKTEPEHPYNPPTCPPGLYYLGLDNLRNFRSRYLRGIRSDAVELAALIARKVNNSAKQKPAAETA